MKRSDVIVKMRQVLIRRRDALRRSLDEEVEHLGDDREDLFEDGVNAQLVQTESRELQAIEHALEQIHEGQYGTCEECDRAIPLARLKALPYATTCINCQRDSECPSPKTHARRASIAAKLVTL